MAEPQSVKAQRDEYRTEMDPIEMFIDECCRRRSETSQIKSSTLFQAYDAWAKENHQYRMTNTKFGKEMKEKFKWKKSNGVQYLGIELLQEYNPNFIKLNL